MNQRTPRLLALALVATLVALVRPASASDWGVRDPTFAEVIQRVTSMPMNAGLRTRAQRHGLNVVNVMWEDTARFAGSSVGPNISDLTLQVHDTAKGGRRTHLLPVIRHPNFADKTADIAAEKMWIRIGNQQGGDVVAVPLTEVLGNMKQYLSDPASLKGDGNFLTKRDKHFLVSAQHVFVPLAKTGKVEFNPVLFNYQSAVDSPAVMTLLVTREGTSATIIENRPGEMSQAGWGQQLFFNNNGQKTLFTAERRSAVKNRIDSGKAHSSDAGALENGADMMMIIQVPLKHANRGFFSDFGMEDEAAAMDDAGPTAAPQPSVRGRSPRSDVENAVLGHGDDLGPFQEMRGLKLERDERFPIRVTVQFYKATSNGVVSDDDLAAVADSIRKVYATGDYVGSLVVPKRLQRSTDWQRPAWHTKCQRLRGSRRRARCRARRGQ